MAGMEMVSLKEDVLPFLVMLLIEVGEVGMTTLGKAAMSTGMNNRVFVVYYNSIGTGLLFIYIIFHCRRRRRPLTFAVLCKFFLLGFLGIFVVQNLAFLGIYFSSPTLASALGNLVPVITFVIAITLRMEKFSVSASSSQAKTIGTLVSIAGALMVTLYKGPAVFKVSPPHNLLSSSEKSNWVLGGLLITISCLSSAVWSIVQATTLNEYPEKMLLVFFSCLFGTTLSVIFSLIIETDSSAWILKPGIQVTATVYSAVFSCVIRGIIIAWCLEKKGPVYVALFKPLTTAIAVIMSLLFLGEILHIGSLLGASIIAIGFYTFMWGKARERDIVSDITFTATSESSNAPLILK